MTCRVEINDGVAKVYTRGGVILLEEEDYKKIKEDHGLLGSSNSVKGTGKARYAYVQFYPRENGKRVRGSKPFRRELLHRFLLNVTGGQQADHRDRNGLNNLRSNLRLCTPKENKQNSSVYKTNKIGLKGVSKISGGFKATITVNNKSLVLGVFPQAEMAARVYDLAAIDHFGEFAALNFEREVIEAWRPVWEQIRDFYK